MEKKAQFNLQSIDAGRYQRLITEEIKTARSILNGTLSLMETFISTEANIELKSKIHSCLTLIDESIEITKDK